MRVPLARVADVQVAAGSNARCRDRGVESCVLRRQQARIMGVGGHARECHIYGNVPCQVCTIMTIRSHVWDVICISRGFLLLHTVNAAVVAMVQEALPFEKTSPGQSMTASRNPSSPRSSSPGTCGTRSRVPWAWRISSTEWWNVRRPCHSRIRIGFGLISYSFIYTRI
jgi:hypothetical protein